MTTKMMANILGAAVLLSACSNSTIEPSDSVARVPTSALGTSTTVSSSTVASTSPDSSVATTSTAPPTSQSATAQPPTDLPACEAPSVFTDVESEAWDSELIGFDQAGSPRWRMVLPDGDGYSIEPVLGRTMVSGSTGGGLALVDPATCALQWQLPTGPTPQVAESEVSFVFLDGDRLTRVDRDLEELWTVTVEPATDLAVLGELLFLTRAGALEVRLLADGTVHHVASLDISTPDTSIAATADTDGLVIRADRDLIKADVVGEVEWIHAASDRVFSATVVGDAIAVLQLQRLTLLDLATGAERWSLGIPPTIEPPLAEHSEIHVLTTEGMLLHFGLDGELIFDGDHRSARTLAEFDDGLVIEIDRGRVTAYSMLEQQAWSVSTGADGVGRLSTLDIVGDTIVTLTFNVEQG